MRSTNVMYSHLALICADFICCIGFVKRRDFDEFLEQHVTFQITDLVPTCYLVDGLQRLGGGALRLEAGQQTVDVEPVVNGARTILMAKERCRNRWNYFFQESYPKGLASTLPILSSPTTHLSLHFLHAARPDLAFSIINGFSMVAAASVSDIILLYMTH